MIHNLPWFVFPFKSVWSWCGGGGGGSGGGGGGGGGGEAPAPTHSFILQNCVLSVLL